MDEYWRNDEIRNLLTIWAWCSRTLRVKWERAHKYRNTCLIGITGAVNEGRFGETITITELPRIYQSLSSPLFTEQDCWLSGRAAPHQYWR
jgi:hypothetical protein